MFNLTTRRRSYSRFWCNRTLDRHALSLVWQDLPVCSCSLVWIGCWKRWILFASNTGRTTNGIYTYLDNFDVKIDRNTTIIENNRFIMYLHLVPVRSTRHIWAKHKAFTCRCVFPQQLSTRQGVKTEMEATIQFCSRWGVFLQISGSIDKTKKQPYSNLCHSVGRWRRW